MDKATAIERFQRQIAEIDTIPKQKRFSPEFKKWRRDTEILIEKVFGEDSRHISDFGRVDYLGASRSGRPDSERERAFAKGLEEAALILTSMIGEIEQYWDEKAPVVNAVSPLITLTRLADRFHLVARQIRSRHNGRPTLEVEDEYDVQDLLHSLLVLEFDDVRPEEWTPSYAGRSSRMDFLLKKERIVIEVKRTRPNLTAREVGDQLLIDIGRYQAHSDCDLLFCFVYDPEGRISNPRGLENDLSKPSNDLAVHVLVRPK